MVVPLCSIQNTKKSLETLKSAERKHHHTTQLRPCFPKNAMDVFPKGKKYFLPGKVQTNCSLGGISQNSHLKLGVWEGAGMENEKKEYVL